jgi:hypothetical protein
MPMAASVLSFGPSDDLRIFESMCVTDLPCFNGSSLSSCLNSTYSRKIWVVVNNPGGYFTSTPRFYNQ